MTAFPETELVDLPHLPDGYTLVGRGGPRGIDVITPDGGYAAAGAAGLLDAARAARRHARGQLPAACPNPPGRGDAETDDPATAACGRPASDDEGPPAADPAGRPAPADGIGVPDAARLRLAERNGHPTPPPAGPDSDPAAAPPAVRVSRSRTGEIVVSVDRGVHVGAVLAALAAAVPPGGRTARRRAALVFGAGDDPRPAPGETDGPDLDPGPAGAAGRRCAAAPQAPARLAALG
jgi:hypothetical protein